MPVVAPLMKTFPSTLNVRPLELTMAEGTPHTRHCSSTFLGVRNKCSECLKRKTYSYHDYPKQRQRGFHPQSKKRKIIVIKPSHSLVKCLSVLDKPPALNHTVEDILRRNKNRKPLSCVSRHIGKYTNLPSSPPSSPCHD